MKILTKDEFLKLPAGVVYCCNESKINVGFSDLRIKGETLNKFLQPNEKPSDWLELRLTEYEYDNTDELCARHDGMLNGASYPLEIVSSRNAIYEDDNIFLVYEHDDLEMLITTLQECRGC